MSKIADFVVSAFAEWNGKALVKADKQISTFDKSVKKLGKTFAAVFSAAALLNYSKNAVKAFMADEKAAKSLEVQLQNLGYGFSAPGVELYIANLERMYGVLDDQLRPAFQTLITASGSLTQSQKALDLALNVSAATGKSVEEVSAALAKGFSGQTTALSRLGAGLDKATLASGDMNKIMDELGRKFSGQAAARLDTYAGKMDLLQASAARASETIGKGILDSLTLLGNDKSIDKITTSMENLATQIANVTIGLASVLKKIQEIGNSKYFPIMEAIGWVFSNTSGIGLLAKLGASESAKMNAPKSNFTYSLGAGAAGEIARVQELKILKEKNKVNKELVAQDKAKLALNDLAKKFDLERIGIMTALNNATDEETKLRLRAQLALLDNNAALATKYSAELEAAKAAKELASSFNAASGVIGVSAKDLAAYLASTRTVSVSPGGYTVNNATAMTNEQAAFINDIVTSNVERKMDRMDLGFPMSSSGSGSSSAEVTVNLNAAGSIIGLQEVDAAIQDALLRIYRQNGDLMPAGFLP
jgi:hypothetical protein